MIICKKDNFVDFKAPVFMSEEQRKNFIKFMKGLFPEQVSTSEVKEKGKTFARQGIKLIKWTVDDYLELFSSDDFDKIVKKTKRSDMGVNMMLGSFYPEVMSWAKKKGYIKINRKVIEEYLKDTGVGK